MRALVLAALVAVGCGSDPSRVKLAIAPASITITEAGGKTHELALAADGAVTLDGRAVGTLATDGRLRAAPDVSLQLVKDGAVLVRGNVSNVIIRDATFLLNDEPALTIGDDGTVTGPLLADIDHPLFVADGATVRYRGDPTTRRAVMFVFAAVLTNALPLPR